MSDEDKCVIEKKVSKFNIETRITTEKRLFVKGGSLKKCRQHFDELWER